MKASQQPPNIKFILNLYRSILSILSTSTPSTHLETFGSTCRSAIGVATIPHMAYLAFSVPLLKARKQQSSNKSNKPFNTYRLHECCRQPEKDQNGRKPGHSPCPYLSPRVARRAGRHTTGRRAPPIPALPPRKALAETRPRRAASPSRPGQRPLPPGPAAPRRPLCSHPPTDGLAAHLPIPLR